VNLKPYYSNLWVVANPHVAYRSARGFFRALVLRRNTLKTIELYPTFACQSRCRMCSVEKYKQEHRATLGLADYESIAKQGARMGAIAMTLLGGEPLLAPEVAEIVRIFKRRHYFITMVSNSLLLSRDMLRTLKAAGLDSVYFSLESLDPETNDEVRGVRGHYDSVMEAIRLCREEQVLAGLCGVIFPGQVPRFVELLEFCARNGLLASGGEVAAVGAAAHEPLVSEADHAAVAALLRRYPRLTFDWGLSYFLKPRCPAGKEKIGITCHGDVVGCSLNPISFGNVGEEPLLSIWRRIGRFSPFDKDSDRCLTAGDRGYIEKYIVPIAGAARNPVSYCEHPGITPELEPAVYGRRARR
jgi:MoaA/NifB/PqqE/SkfB family radical SAM enzyme